MTPEAPSAGRSEPRGRAEPQPLADLDAAVESDAARWSARGSVRALAGGEPVAGARIALDVVLADGRTRTLATTESAADGTFRAVLPGLSTRSATELAGARVAARVEARGFQPGRARAPLAPGAPLGARRVELEIRLAEGALVRGRAVDTHGAPVPRATAAIALQDGRSGPGGLTLVDEAEAGDDGRFVLGFAAGATLHLALRADGFGVHAREIEARAREDLDVGDVVLGGGDRLAGIARHVDGTPARHLELLAMEGEALIQPDGFASVVRRAREVERGEGLSWSRTTTDEGGAFEFRALRMQHFAIVAADPAVVVEPRQARFQPGQTDLELRVETPLLVVRVVDEHGQPVHGALVEVVDLGLDEAGGYVAGGSRRAATRGPGALAAFSVDPETPMAVRARLGARASPEQLVFFGTGVQHLERELALAPRAQGGRLRLVLADAALSGARLRVALASPVTGLVDLDLGVRETDEDGVLEGLPPGAHRLFVEVEGPAGAWLFPWSAREPVQIPSEGEALVTIVPERGGRLALTAELVGPPPTGFDGAAPPAMQRERFGARFVLVPAAGGAERSLDLVVGGESGFLLLPGETGEVRDLLLPGDYELRLEGARWISTRTRVRLVAGQRLAAHVELRAR
ncbi:MAG: hypothetical protein JNK02_12925 [Planctomycetes bacterium]|nr:hypothetical protein [Planctomycetota bacterium]